jgi:hypothetical protein
MEDIFSARVYRTFLSCVFLFCLCAPSWGDLSAPRAFTLLGKIPPGEDMAEAVKFLGKHTSEKTIDAKEGIKIWRWGAQSDKWMFDVLHDGKLVRAARITWMTNSRREQQIIFAQLTSEGRKFFGRRATYRGSTDANWSDFGEKWIVRAKQGDALEEGVTLLSGIRDATMGSAKYGF